MECIGNEAERNVLINLLDINKFDVGIFNCILAKPMSAEAVLVYALVTT